MRVGTFLLRLVGRDPEMVASQKQFEKNLEKMDETDKKMDEVISSIQEVCEATKQKDCELKKTATTMRPVHEVVGKLLETQESNDVGSAGFRKPSSSFSG